MNSSPLVSVITIFFNEEKFIQEAIESVFVQTYSNWELLLVDDGSTDSSTQIALQYSEKYPEKVRYFQHNDHKNLGKSTSRNLGIKLARGEYITFLDADDVFLPEKLERQVAILNSHPDAGMVYGLTQYWYSWTGNPQDVRCDRIGKLGVPTNTLFNTPNLLTLFLRDGGIVPCICSLLVRRGIVEDIGGFDGTIQHMYEDQVFLAKICLKAPILVHSDCGERYRQHQNSSSYVAIRSGEYNPLWPNPARQTFINWLIKYVSEKGVDDIELWKALRNELWSFRHPILYRLLNAPRFLIQQARGQIRQTIAHRISYILPVTLNNWLERQWPRRESKLNFGDLQRLTPISREFGFDRGLPIDRYYIENFLALNANDIRGRVLEIGDNSYTLRFGDSHVTKSDVLHVVEGNPQATLIGDLTRADHVPSDAFDCLILTQTLHIIYDIRAALQTIYRILKPGGVMLATFPGISQVSKDQWSDYWCWSFTTLSARRMFEEFFPAANIKVASHGNVLAAVAFLQGLATEELNLGELDYHDPDYEVLITVRAVKPV